MADFVAIPSIVVICLLLAQTYKSFVSETLYKHIPVLCGITGGVIGAGCFIFIPAYIPAENIIVAIAIGIVSGFSATGVNQIYKQEMGE